MFQWTADMKKVGATPALEEATRVAIVKAVEYLLASGNDAEKPRFNGNHVMIATNDAAAKMQDAITAHLESGVSRRDRRVIVTTAVLAATSVCARGRSPEDVWKALAAKLQK